MAGRGGCYADGCPFFECLALQLDATVPPLEASGTVRKVKRVGLAAKKKKKGCLIEVSRPFVIIDSKYILSDSLFNLISIAMMKVMTNS